MIHKKYILKFLIHILLLYIFFMSSANCNSLPEDIFLKQLHSKNISKKNFHKIINNNPDTSKILSDYYLSLPKLWVLLQSFCYTSLKLDNPFPLEGKMNEYLNQNKPISSNDLYVLFKPLINNKKFTIKSGDIIMILPHDIGSYIRAYTLDSAYSHQDIIYVNDKGEPKVITISPDTVAIVDFVDYIIGIHTQNSRFAIYRYNKPINMNLLQNFLKKIESNINNLFFDEPFQRNTEINDIDSFLTNPSFYYCGELIYAIYSKVLKSNDFINKKYISIREMFENRGVKITNFTEHIIKYAERMETQNEQWIIDPQNFYLSKDFTPTVTYGENISIKKMFSNNKNNHDKN